MVNTMFTPRYGSRTDAVHVAVIVTDGKSQDRKKTIETAALARKAGIHVFAIGVGDLVEYRELEEIASRPPEEYVFAVDDFKGLDAMKYILANKTCTGMNYFFDYLAVQYKYRRTEGPCSFFFLLLTFATNRKMKTIACPRNTKKSKIKVFHLFYFTISLFFFFSLLK